VTTCSDYRPDRYPPQSKWANSVMEFTIAERRLQISP